MTFAVERSTIAPPLPRSNRWRHGYPWNDLGVGDSFFVPNGNRGTLSGLAWRRGFSAGKKFSTHLDLRDGVSGIRVMRRK